MEWKLHSKKPYFKKLVENTKKIIENALLKARFCISWSGGKDSTALVHLVKSIDIDDSIPIIIQFDDCDWPEKQEYVNLVSQEQSWEFYSVEPSFSIWEAVKNYRIGYDNICSLSHDITKDGFIAPLEKEQKELSCNGVFLGLRAAESKMRATALYSHGHTYQLKSGAWKCCPLWQWKTIDVFSYLISNDIPINQCYFNNKFYAPEDIRLSWILPTPTGLSHGQMEHVRYYYPEIYRRIKSLYGDLS